MTKLLDELRRKYKTPRDAVLALGLDAALIDRAKTFDCPAVDEETQAAVSARIKREIDRGHPFKQAAAIAYKELGKDMEPRDWEGLVKFIAEEMGESEHADDAGFEEGKHPRDEGGKFGAGGGNGGEKKSISRAEMKKKLESTPHAKLMSALNNSNVDPKIKKEIEKELDSRANRGTSKGFGEDSKPASDRAGDSQRRSVSHKESSTMKSLSKKAVMARGALVALLAPSLAADAMPDLNAILAGVKRKNWKEKKPGILKAIRPYLASDAEAEEAGEALNRLDEADQDDTVKDGKYDDVMEHLRGKISDEDLAIVEELLNKHEQGQDAEETEEEKRRKEAEANGTSSDQPPGFEGKPKDPVTAKAMDAAIKAERARATAAMDAAVADARKQATADALRAADEINKAREETIPYVGRIAIACDSADAVYKAALGMLKVETKGVHPSAYRHILMAQPKPGNRPQIIARDGIVDDDFKKEFPDAGRLDAA